MTKVLHLQAVERLGVIEQCIGLKLAANGPPQSFIGELCEICDFNNQVITQAEVIGFAKGQVFLLPFSEQNIRPGYKVKALGQAMHLPMGMSLLGRIVDPFINPLDDLGPIPLFSSSAIKKPSINPLHRQVIEESLFTGVHAIDGLLPLGKGQRMGLFAGSGVGKSRLLGRIAEQSSSDVNVIALVGERGREVADFVSQHLNENSMKKTVLLVACSSDSAFLRKQAVFSATALAEYFCAQGKDVLLLVDSITRFAMAQREIGLSLGEPPTARGYTPTVFSLLPQVIERAGNFKGQGSITALYTVLVEGDDLNEPIADTMRSLLDGHIVLTRELAERGHFPAIDILQSVSRLAQQLLTKEQQIMKQKIVAILSLYHQNKDLIEIGAYQPGHNAQLDSALEKMEGIQRILIQENNSPHSKEDLFHLFSKALL